jgi:replicative DNA helicase
MDNFDRNDRSRVRYMSPSQQAITIDRVMPCNLEAERAILGAILVEQPHLFAARENLSIDDFYLEAHRIIFRAFHSLQQSETAIDLITLKAELHRSGKLEAVGGAPYIASLTNGMPGALNVRHYAGLVRQASIRRQVIQLTSAATNRAFQDEEECCGIIESLQMELLKLAEAGRKKAIWIKSADLVRDAYLEIEAIAQRKTDTVGLDTGFRQLNRMTQGFKRGDLIIVAGRPGHGKSSWATNVITNGILRHGWRVGLFTIEMSAVEIMKRALYAEAEIDSYRAGSGYLNRDDWRRLAAAASQLAESRLNVDESGGLTIGELRSRAQSLAVEGNLDLVVVDYLQLMSGSGRRTENRVAEITEISRGLKILAKDLNAPVIALSQLSRAIEGDKNRKPILSDLRESGSIEQDADIVLFIWREELRSGKEEDHGKAELIIGKQRNGPTGNINLVFLSKFTKFVDATSQQELPGYE